MRPLHTLITPRRGMFVLTAAGAAALGLLLPGILAAAAGYTAALTACLYYANSAAVTPALPWMSSDGDGLTLNAVLLRSGAWWPNVTYKPNVITPAEAVKVLRQAADQITDDWDLPR